jgi:PEGA domain-containing protein
MRRIFALLLCIAIPLALFAKDSGYKVIYDGGSLSGTKSGADVKLYIEGSQIRYSKDKTDLVTIPASAITEISYGQEVHRRVGTAVAVGVFTLGVGALVALSKSKKHYIGLIWADGDKKGGLAMQCDKNDYRGILAALEGLTGKKAVDSDTMMVKSAEQSAQSAPPPPVSAPAVPTADNSQADPSVESGPALPPASIIVKSTPPGADINVDGKFMGSTPSTIQLAPGDHQVSIEKENLTPWQRTMTVTAGGNSNINATLAKP